jgi:hypothetical protein
VSVPDENQNKSPETKQTNQKTSQGREMQGGGQWFPVLNGMIQTSISER